MDTNYTSTTTIESGMRCRTTYAPSGACFATDVAPALGGLGEKPSPGEMLASCVASCMLSMVAYTGKQKGFDTCGISVRAGYEAGKAGITALVFDITVPMPTPPVTRRFIEGAVKSCPVGNAIAPTVEKRVSWNWAE